jgi:hypothetical protein
MLKGKYKFWDGKNIDSVVEEDVFICDQCKKEITPFITAIGTVPYDMIDLSHIKKDTHLCLKCIQIDLFCQESLTSIILAFNEYSKWNNRKLFEELQPIFYYLQKDVLEPRKKITKKLREDLIKEAEFQCFYCKNKYDKSNLHIDHIIPISKGGLSNLENLVVACKKCNILKGIKSADEFLKTNKPVENL